MDYPNIPQQTKGEFNDVVNMFCANSEKEAFDAYQILENRLTAVNDWHELSDKVKTSFSLFSANGTKNTSDLDNGNHIRIDIPGIGNPSGSGYDWTEITEVQTSSANAKDPFFLITIKPCPAPDSKNDSVAHFYTDDSTNTFIVRKLGNCIYAEVHGRNEMENTSDVPIKDSVRNKAVAIGG
ncbi:hypothetical protein LCGC14_1847050, partial [marine sediment metagenome]